MSQYEVGQKVLIDSANRRGRPLESATVVRVGRKLVYIMEYGREVAFRIEDGRKNDSYGHEWLTTEAEQLELERRNRAIDAIRLGGLEPRMGGVVHSIPTETLEKVADILSGPTSMERFMS